MRCVLRHDLTTQILRGDGSSATVTASFFFYDGGSRNQKSLLGLLLCILGQIIEQAPLLAQIIQPVFNKLRTIDGKRTWNLVSLQDALQRICEQRKS